MSEPNLDGTTRPDATAHPDGTTRPDGGAVCAICPHHCHIPEGGLGRCRARTVHSGEVVCDSYGRVTSIALDPIEKKPLARFRPGSSILSVGSYGCNLKCPFCQNSEISFANAESVPWKTYTPKRLVDMAVQLSRDEGNIGIAYTYNEPLIGYEFVRDTARLVHERGLANVLVTNGMVCTEPLEALLPLIDALNIDLKAFTQAGYDLLGGDLETVKDTIRTCAALSHVEVTTLLIPGFNDTEDEVRSMAGWLAGIDPDIPYHLSRFFPCFHMTDRSSTPVREVFELADVAREYLRYVYTGNC